MRTGTAETGLVSPDAKTAIPLLGTGVTAEVAGRGTRVTVAQRFRNTGGSRIEAVYKFPLPEAAAVCGFRAVTDGRWIEGRIEDRDAAFDRYDKAIADGHGAYLLDQERPNIFTLSVGNLKPGQEAVLEIEYVAILPTFGRETRFALPTTIAPRYVPEDTPDEEGMKTTDRVNPEFAPDVPYGLTLSLDIAGVEGIASVESPSHRIRQEFRDGTIHVEFTSGDVKMDRDFILNVVRKEGFENSGFAAAFGGDVFVQAELSPRDEGEAPDARQEIVFLLDCSGSMGGDSIDEARRALIAALGRLEPGSVFNLYRFGSRYEKAFPESVPYTRETLEAARAWVSGVQADLGGTELLPPLKKIYGKEGTRRTVLLITDGQVGNEEQVLDLVRDNASTTRFFAIGIGYGPNEHLLRGAARMGNGACEMIAPGERIEGGTLRLLGKVMGRTVSEVKLSAGGEVLQAPAAAVLFTGETTSVFARIKGINPSALKAVTVTGKMDGKEISWEVPLSALSGEKAPVPVLWAREAIRDIEDGNSPAAVGGSRKVRRQAKESRDAALALSKEFGIASFAASFVAIEKREQEDGAAEEPVLGNVPVMITRGWHGTGRFPALRNPLCASRVPPWSASGARRMHTAAPATSRGDSRMSRLMDILACQRSEGGFSLDARGAKAIGVPLETIKDAAAKVTCGKRLDPYAVLCTALVFAYLHGPAADMRETWEAVVEKSRKWLEVVTKAVSPTVGTKSLSEWAAAFFATA